jgi:hypothetical protein
MNGINDHADQAIKGRAVELNGTTVLVNLMGGTSLTGTLDYETTSGAFGVVLFPDVLTITVSTKVHTVPTAYVVSIGQG